MQLNEKTLKFIEGCITGDSGITTYKTGNELVDYFNKFGFDDTYEQGFSSRRYYVSQKLIEINGTDKITDVILDIFHPINFVESSNYDDVLESLNKYLLFDDYKLIVVGKSIEIVPLVDEKKKQKQEIVEMELFDDDYILKQYSKCKEKLDSGDFDGAITNARTLIESVFGHIYSKVYRSELEKSGDLQKDYKKIKDCLDLTGEQRTDDAIKSIVNNISGIIGSIDALSNSMGDRHRRTVEPKQYQARFVVETAISLTNYVYGVFKYNLHSVDEILETIKPLFDKGNIYRYDLKIDKENQYNDIHIHPIALGLKQRLTALKGREIIRYLIETVDIQSWETSGRFFGTMILLDAYLTKDDVDAIFDKTIFSYNNQACDLRWFLTNLQRSRVGLLSVKTTSLLNVMTKLNVRYISQVMKSIYEDFSYINIIRDIGEGKFIADIIGKYYTKYADLDLDKVVIELNK